MLPALPPADEPESSAGLLERVQAHGQDAWRRLVRLYGPLVVFWVRHTGLQAADAEDVSQEVFRAVVCKVGTFREDRPGDSFRGWLRAVTRSKLADHHRRLGSQPRAVGGPDMQRRLQELAETDAGDPDEGRPLDGHQLRAMELVRAEFEERTWRMFWEVAVEGRATSEVAGEQGVTPSAVRLAKSRVLRRLREEMRGLER